MSFLPSLPEADMKQTLKCEPDTGIPFSQLNQAVMRGNAPFTPGERELIAAYVSALNACHYCQSEHTALAETFGIPLGYWSSYSRMWKLPKCRRRCGRPWCTLAN